MRNHALLVALICAAAPAAALPVVGPAQPVTPSLSSQGQRFARVAAGTDGFLVVWAANIGGQSRVRAARVALDGTSLDQSGITVTSATGGQFDPAVAFGHGVYLVAWSDMRSGEHALYATRVTPAGEVLDAGGVLLSTEPSAARMPDVAATPDGFLLAWAQAEPSGRGFVARARRLAADAQPIDAEPVRITDVAARTDGEDFGHSVYAEISCQHVRVAMLGSTALIIWAGSVGQEQANIAGALFDVTSGSQTRPATGMVAGSSSRIYDPAVAAVDGKFLFSWTDFRDRGRQGRPSDNAGWLTLEGSESYAPLQETAEARVVWSPAVASNGLVAFVSPQTVGFGADRRLESWLILRQVLADGTSPGADVIVDTNAAWPTLATHASGVTLLVYTTVNTPTANGMLKARAVAPLE